MKLFQFSLFGLTFILVGCVHYKEYPFPYSKTATIDKRLVGVWKVDINQTDFPKLFHQNKPENDEHYIVFKPNKNNTMYTIYGDSVNDPSNPILQAYTSSLSKVNYLNVSQGKDSNEFMHYKYIIKNNKLIIYRVNQKVLMEDIKNNTISGIVSPNSMFPSINEIYIIEKAEIYKKYLLTHDKKLYDIPLYLTQ